MYHHLFIDSSTNEHLSCCQILALTNNAIFYIFNNDQYSRNAMLNHMKHSTLRQLSIRKYSTRSLQKDVCDKVGNFQELSQEERQSLR